MAGYEHIHEVTPAELNARVDAIALKLGLHSREEAFAALDRGDLDGMWLEVELKLVRHLLGESPRHHHPIAAE